MREARLRSEPGRDQGRRRWGLGTIDAASTAVRARSGADRGGEPGRDPVRRRDAAPHQREERDRDTPARSREPRHPARARGTALFLEPHTQGLRPRRDADRDGRHPRNRVRRGRGRRRHDHDHDDRRRRRRVERVRQRAGRGGRAGLHGAGPGAGQAHRRAPAGRGVVVAVLPPRAGRDRRDAARRDGGRGARSRAGSRAARCRAGPGSHVADRRRSQERARRPDRAGAAVRDRCGGGPQARGARRRRARGRGRSEFRGGGVGAVLRLPGARSTSHGRVRWPRRRPVSIPRAQRRRPSGRAAHGRGRHQGCEGGGRARGAAGSDVGARARGARLRRAGRAADAASARHVRAGGAGRSGLPARAPRARHRPHARAT